MDIWNTLLQRIRPNLPLLICAGMALGWFVAFLLPSWSALWHAEIKNIDRELLALNVVQASQGDLFTGAYSRFGFRHPGPLFFYLLAGFDLLFDIVPSLDGRLRLGTWSLNLLFLLATLWLANRALLLNGRIFWLLSAIVLTIHVPFLFLFANYWNPWIVPLPLLVGLFCAVLTLQGDWRWLPLLIFSWSLSAQSHIAAVPVVAGLSAVVLGMAFWRRPAGPPLKQLLLSAAVALIVWLPVVIDALIFPQGGNTGRILEFFLAAERSGMSWRKLEFFLSFFTMPFRDALAPGWRAPLGLLVWLGPICAWRLFNHATRTLALLSLCGGLVCLLSAQRIEGPLVAYLLAPAYTFASLSWLLLFILFDERLLRLCLPRPSLRAGVACTCLIAALLCRWPEPHPRRAFPELEMVQRFVDQLPKTPNTLTHLTFPSRRMTPMVTSVLLQGLLRGHTMCIGEQWAYLFGDSLRCDYQRRSHGAFGREVRVSIVPREGHEARGAHYAEGKFLMLWEDSTIVAAED